MENQIVKSEFISIEEASKLTKLSKEEILKNYLYPRLEYAYNQANHLIQLDIEVLVRLNENTNDWYIDYLVICTEYNNKKYELNSVDNVITVYPTVLRGLPYNVTREAIRVTHNLPKYKKLNLKKITALLNEAQDQGDFAVEKFNKETNKFNLIKNILNDAKNDLNIKCFENINSIEYIITVYPLYFSFNLEKNGYIYIKNNSNYNFKNNNNNTDLLAKEIIEFFIKLKTL